MKRIKGYNIIMKLNSKKVVGVTSNSFSIKPNIKDSLIKDDFGKKQYENFGYEAEFGISGLMCINAQGDTANYNDITYLRQCAKEGTLISFVYGGFTAGDATESGNLIITDYKEDTDSENNGTYSVTCKLSGEMTSGTVAEG
jgi:hypothetical protein